MIELSLSDPELIPQAVNVLRRGGIIVYPTDTLYGFGVVATDGAALRQLNHLKGRSGPMSVIAPDFPTARSWARCSEAEWSLIQTRLGGPTTVIFPVHEGVVHPLILGPNHTLGVRVPNQPTLLALVARLKKPLTTTSVNRTGEQPCNDPRIIARQFGKEIDLLIDGGHLPPSRGSRIFKLEHEALHLIRS